MRSNHKMALSPAAHDIIIDSDNRVKVYARSGRLIMDRLAESNEEAVRLGNLYGGKFFRKETRK